MAYIMKKSYLISILLILFLSAYGQTGKKNFKIVSYNVENYFDVEDNPEKNDEEYLPGGMRGWSKSKYYAKQNNISKTITAIGGWEAPAIVGICEVESELAVKGLVKMSPLKNLKYEYIHYESPDRRGIDVALLYHPYKFRPFHSEPISILRADSTFRTRDILYVAGKTVETEDTLHIFMCHFPSRWGGELESESRRLLVASVLRQKVDSIFATETAPNIVIMGDFNDYPNNNSVLNVLKANPLNEGFEKNELYNLSFRLEEQGKGSHKYQGEWGMLDQMIVSGNLLDNKKRISTTIDDAHVFDADFLLEDDKTFLGKKTLRTYVGMRYLGGYSDHLPIYLDLWY